MSEKDQLVQRKRETSIKSLYFNRFILIRFSLAIFFFSNFLLAAAGWGYLCGYIGLALLILSLYPCWEMTRIYGDKKVKYKATKIFLIVQWVFIIASLVLVWTAPMSVVFPFLKEGMQSVTFMTVLLLIGLIASSWSLWRIRQIDHNTDKTWRRIKFYEEKYGISIG